MGLELNKMEEKIICNNCSCEKSKEEMAYHKRNKETGEITSYKKTCKKCDSLRRISQDSKEKQAERNRRLVIDGRKKPVGTRLSQRRGLLKRKYNLSWSKYKEMLELQGHRCCICQKKRKLVVDHCHISGEVRGLLCGNCNTGIGMLKDNASILERAAEYLKLHSHF